MQLKKVFRGSVLFLGSLMCLGSFQNCTDQSQFSTLSSVDLASSEFGSSSDGSELSYSGVTHVAPTEKIANIDYSPVVMDRIGIVNFFQDIFGNGARSLSAVRSIATDANIFGGGCSFYKMATTAPSDDLTRCGNSASWQAVKPLMGITTLRQGRINQACYELSTNATTRAYVLARIDSTKTYPDLTTANMKSLFALFYRMRPEPEAGLYEAMLANAGTADAAGWTRAVYGICVSGHWQVL